MATKLNLGCGKKPKKGYVNIDKFRLPGVNKVLNLEKNRLPFADSSVDEICASHIIEHIDNFFHVMEECWRVLKPGCRMIIEAPYFRTSWSRVCPDHKREFGVWTWYAFDPGNPENYMTKARFRTKKIRLYWFGKKRVFFYPFELLINRMPKIYEELFSHLLPAEQMSVVLEAVK